MSTSTRKSYRLLAKSSSSLAKDAPTGADSVPATTSLITVDHSGSDGQPKSGAAFPSNGNSNLYTSPAPSHAHIKTDDDSETIDGEDARSPSPNPGHGKQAHSLPPYNFRQRHGSRLTEAQLHQVESDQKEFGHAVPLISELLGPSFTHYNIAAPKATSKRKWDQLDEAPGGQNEAAQEQPKTGLKIKLRHWEPKPPKLYIRIKLRPLTDEDAGDIAPPQKRPRRSREPSNGPSTTVPQPNPSPPNQVESTGDHTYSTRSKTVRSPPKRGAPVNNMPNHPHRETFRVENGVLHLGMFVQIPFKESKKEKLKEAYKRLFGVDVLPEDWRNHIRFTSEGDWVARDADHPFLPIMFKMPKAPTGSKW